VSSGDWDIALRADDGCRLRGPAEFSSINAAAEIGEVGDRADRDDLRAAAL
jgi:hypothetical protein